ncbi:MAG: ABC transporter permease [Bacteroidetes bacterium]|nr:MAG: ABC transporter permease [Bacteroidota bacterium]
MRNNIISTIFKKELREVLRDKRMIYLIILLPFFTYPVLFTLIGKVGQNQQEKIRDDKVTLLVNPESAELPIVKTLEAMLNLEVEPLSFTKDMIDTMSTAIGVQIDQKPDSNGDLSIAIYFDESKDLLNARKHQVVGVIKAYEKQVVQQRLAQQELPPEFIDPVLLEEVNMASDEQIAGKILGSFLPMLLLIFIFVGCIYIAIDITSGEKERKTLQSLFTAPIHVPEIIAGKFLAVFCVGLVSALMNVLSLMVAMLIQVRLMGGADAMGTFAISISTEGWLWIGLIVFLTTIFLAALTLAVVQLANSYKEAQSYVSPLMMVVIIPAVLSQMPGMELTMSTAMIPMLNIALALGAVLKGTYDIVLIGAVAASVVVYAALSLWLASKVFRNENVTTGQKVSLKKLFG